MCRSKDQSASKAWWEERWAEKGGGIVLDERECGKGMRVGKRVVRRKQEPEGEYVLTMEQPGDLH